MKQHKLQCLWVPKQIDGDNLNSVRLEASKVLGMRILETYEWDK
jgi:hypothetical protein